MHKENEIIVNRQLKDSLFTHLFKDIKYLKKLYSALYDDADSYEDEDFKLITLENTLVYDIYNDLGLLVKDKLILFFSRGTKRIQSEYGCKTFDLYCKQLL